MSRHSCASLVLVGLVFSMPAHAAWAHRYDALARAQRSAIAALPEDRYVVAAVRPHAIMILDANGEVQTARAVDGAEVRYLTANGRGEIYVVARRDSSPNDSLLVALRPDLSVNWTRVIAAGDGAAVGILRAASTRDGGVVLAAHLAASTVIIKVTAAGDVEWTTSIDPSDNDMLRTISQTRDGGYLAGGESPRWPWLIRLSSDGTILWQRAYGPDSGHFRSVVEAENGELFAAGNSSNRAMFVRANSKGDVLWAEAAPPLTTGGSAIEYANGTITTFTSGDLSSVLHLVALSRDGSIEWQQIFDTGQDPLRLYEFEDALLASHGRGMALPIARRDGLTVISDSTSTGPTGCGWVPGERSGLTPLSLRDEALVVERSRPRLKSLPAAIRLLPLAARASQPSCTDPHAVRAAAVALRPVLPDPYRDDFKTDPRSLVELLVARKFDELEKLAETARNGRSLDPVRPNNPLHSFYRAFEDNGVAPIDVRLQRMREWVERHPDSIVAHVALATVLYKAAWMSRGSGYGYTVTSTGAADYDRLMSEVVETLDCAGVDALADPHYWSLTIAATHELGLGDVRQVGLRALMLHPDPMLAEDVVRFLHPQWGGTPAEYLQFADAASRVTERTYGDAMYMWLVTRIQNIGSSEAYKAYDVEWSRVVRGAERLIAMQPGWVPTYHRYAKLAYRYEDDTTLRRLFERPELQWYEGAEKMWLVRQIYDSAREHALANR